LHRWTKYAKRGLYIDKKEVRMKTSLALSCSVSKPLLDDLEKTLQMLNLEANDSLSNMRENVPVISNDSAIDIVNNTISFTVC
jgi:hypothetical protein